MGGVPGSARRGAADDRALRASEFGRQVRDALARLHDVPYLQTHPLTRYLPPDLPTGSASRGRALQSGLLDVLEALRPAKTAAPNAGGGRTHRLLTLRYVEAMPVSEVWPRLDIRASEYFREHRTGLVAVISLLQQRWGLPGQAVAATPPPLARPTNLPRALTSFVGRERELTAVRRQLAGTRLLTLTGPGGSGKTRLALQVAADLNPGHRDGVWLVDLAPLADPVLVPKAVASVLGIREQPDHPLLDQLVDALKPRQLLLLLDNCEHLSGACAEFADAVLRECSDLTILATSRESLAVPGETVWPVPPLPVPDPGRPSPVESLARYAAVELFLHRAATAQPGFALTDRNAAAVVQVCHRLEGIPLAIELAAARVKVLAPEQIAARLDEAIGSAYPPAGAGGFRLLSGGSRTAPTRQQTLRATIDWSYDLLAEQEKALFTRLSVFAGGCTLDAVEAACVGDGISVDEVLDVLAHLVDRSLVVVTDTDEGTARYRLLEMLRQYGWERLAERGELGAIRRRHATYHLSLAEEAEPRLTGPTERVWLERLEREHDNLRAAIQWSVESGEVEVGLRLGGALWRFWAVHGHLREGRERLAALLALPAPGAPSGPPTASRAKALHAAGTLAAQQGDYAAARSYLEASIAARRNVGERSDLANSLNNLGIVARFQGDLATARALYEESLGIQRELDNTIGIAWALGNLGLVFRFQGDNAAARPLLEESLVIRRELGDQWAIANALNNLAEVALDEGDLTTARALLEEGLAINQELGDRRAIAFLLEDFGALAAAQGQARRALCLIGAAAALRASIGSPLSAIEQAKLERALAPTRSALSEADRAVALEQGRAMTLDEAVAYARDAGVTDGQPASGLAGAPGA